MWDHCCDRKCHSLFALYCTSTRVNIMATLAALTLLYLNNDVSLEIILDKGDER